jgi:hypothetical protein
VSEQQQQIREERGADYGPFRQHWTATGHGWGGLLIQMGWTPPASGVAIDPRHVGLFFVVDKAMREAFKHKADNPLDGCNYFTMSGEAAEDQPDAVRETCRRCLDAGLLDKSDKLYVSAEAALDGRDCHICHGEGRA